MADEAATRSGEAGGGAAARTFRVAADIGGTFTDLAFFAEDGTVATHKVPSTPDDYGRAVVEGLAALLAEVGAAPREVAEVLHGCTVATNAILERRGARTALITTRGFRDVLEFRRIRVPRLYDPLWKRPDPLAPRELRFEVTERVAADGSVVTRLREADVRAAIAALKRERVEAVAVSFLNSYANPAHERRVGAMLRRALPGLFVTLSTELLPEMREYERTSTAVINSYVGPPVAGYVAALDRGLRRAGIGGRLLVMQSGGGILDADTVCREPARIVECGPAAGVIGAAHQARLSGERDVITLDMGGTTAKASMIEGGRVLRTDEYEVGGGISLSSRLVKGGGYALKLPVIDISEVGAGGGSVVWFDSGGALKVGPRSAGAVPGPACYGRGGADATVTDANVVLGFVNPTALAGGTVPIDAALARRAIDGVARTLRGSADDAAWAVFVVASATMMRAIKAVSTYRGRDPRDSALMAFGGNGGIFAAELARQLQIRRVLVPPAAGVFSALGLGVAPMAFSRSRAFLARLDRVAPAALERAFSELERDVTSTLRLPRERLEIRRQAAMRYAGQAFELAVPFAAAVDREALAAAADAFETEHERTYGHRLDRGDGLELVALEVTARADDDRDAPAALAARTTHPTPASRREAYFGPAHGRQATPVVDRSALSAAKLRGPLIIEEYEGTTVVPPGDGASLDRFGNIVIEVAP